jgi:NAD(P)H-hydrate epimerase
LLKNSVEVVTATRISAARDLAQRYQAVVLLKGHRSVVASPEGSVWVNGSGSPALATAGTGDVLAGSIAAWVAQKVPPKEAAGLGAYVNGVAGDLAGRNSYGLGVRARDVAERIPEAIGTL